MKWTVTQGMYGVWLYRCICGCSTRMNVPPNTDRIYCPRCGQRLLPKDRGNEETTKTSKY